MSLEGLQAQTLASLPGGTRKFCLCSHSWLTDTCLCIAPPSFPHCPSISWHTQTLVESPPPRVTRLLPTSLPQSGNILSGSQDPGPHLPVSGGLSTILHSVCPRPTSWMRETLPPGFQQAPLCPLPRRWGCITEGLGWEEGRVTKIPSLS